MRRRFRVASTLTLATLFVAGCGSGESVPWSPTPEQDPMRHQQAQRAEAEAKRRNQAAEKVLAKRRHIALPKK